MCQENHGVDSACAVPHIKEEIWKWCSSNHEGTTVVHQQHVSERMKQVANEIHERIMGVHRSGFVSRWSMCLRRAS